MNQLIPERLKLAREKKGITMAEAARRLKLSKIGYCRYEYGERTPSPQTVEVIARCFDTSCEYLTGITEDMSPNSITIDRNTYPELFELVRCCLTDKPDITPRILKYYTSIMENRP